MKSMIVRPTKPGKNPQEVNKRSVRELKFRNKTTGEEMSRMIDGEREYSDKPIEDVICFSYDLAKRRYRTGLDEQIQNPWKGKDIQDLRDNYSLDNTWTDTILNRIVDADKISRQTFLEIKHGVQENLYTSIPNKIDSDTGFPIGSDTFIAKFTYVLYDRLNRITDSTPRTEMAMQLMTVAATVAPSKESMSNARYRWYIADELEEEKERADLDDLENDAMYELRILTKEATPFKMYQVASLLTTPAGSSLVKGEVSEIQLRDILNRYVKEPNRKRRQNLEQFISTARSSRDGELAPEFNAKYILQQCINEGIFRYSDGQYRFKSNSNPDIITFARRDKAENFILLEQRNFNPQEPDGYYAEILDRLKERGIRTQ